MVPKTSLTEGGIANTDLRLLSIYLSAQMPKAHRRVDRMQSMYLREEGNETVSKRGRVVGSGICMPIRKILSRQSVA